MAVLPGQLGCDKCGEAVPANNDATLLGAYISGNAGTVLFCAPRHLLPTDNCEGSPSRAQYLEGQPRDTRGYPYHAENEQVWRDGYALLQEHA